MSEVLDTLLTIPPPFNMIVLIMGLIVVGGLLERLIKAVQIYADNRAKERFKLELIHNGLSPEEAQRWIKLSVGKRRRSPRSCRKTGEYAPASSDDASSVLA